MVGRAVIVAPPGTGKTYTAVRVLEAWAKQDYGTILAVDDSNVAVDNLLEGLLELGVRAWKRTRVRQLQEE